MSESLIVKVSGAYVNTTKDYEVDCTLEEWDKMSTEEKEDLVRECIFEYADAWVETESGKDVDW